jgi:signal transduction histidine kinase
MHSYNNSHPEDLLTTLVHDLRQPIDNIGTSAYILTLITDPDQARAHEQFRAIERQVAQATRLLGELSDELSRQCGHRADAAESFDLTKSEIAAVT